MYIEFQLPKQSSSNYSVTAFVNREITLALQDWSNRYNVLYNTKLHKYTRRVTFDDDAHYTLFSMTWNPTNDPYLSKWRIVSDLNNKI